MDKTQMEGSFSMAIKLHKNSHRQEMTHGIKAPDLCQPESTVQVNW